MQHVTRTMCMEQGTKMAFDPTIALQVNNEVVPPPMEFLQHLANLRQRKNQNKLFAQENEARIGTGEAYTNALRPDGSLDDVELMKRLAADPRAAFTIPTATAAAQARKQEQLKIDNAAIANVQQRAELIGSGLGALLALGPSVGIADVNEWAAKTIAQVNNPQFTFQLLREIKELPADPANLRKALMQKQLQVASIADRLAITHPVPTVIDSGGETNVIRIPRDEANLPEGLANVTKTPTPGERNATVDRQDPTGAPLPPVPVGQVMPMLDGRGNLNSMPDPILAATPLGPPPSAIAGATQTLKQHIDYRLGLDKQISQAEQEIRQIAEMRELLDKARTGGLSEIRTRFAKFMQGMPGVSEGMIDLVQGGDMVAAETFAKKTFTAAYMSLRAMTPPGTQLTEGEVMANWASSPRLDMSPNAIEKLFNYSTRMFQYMEKEREFMDNWPADQPLSKARGAWTKKALADKLITTEIRPQRDAPKFFEGFEFGPGVPDGFPGAKVPDGATVTFEFNGAVIKIKRTGKTLEVVP